MSHLDLIGPNFIDPAVIQESALDGDFWYPYAAIMPLTPEATSQPRRVMTTFILHTMAGPNLTSLLALYAYMNRLDITGECTWILDMAGRCAQTLPCDVRADNNFLANGFATSVETQDRGYIADPGIALTPWTDWQLAQLAGLTAWQVLNPHLHIPFRRADNGWDGGGIDGHRRYPEWSKFKGKTCPGQARWEQIPLVMEAAELIVNWTPSPPSPPPDPPLLEDDDMLFICTVDETVYVGDGVRATAVPGSALPTLEANMTIAPRWRHPARKDLPVLTAVDQIPKINAVQRDLLVGRVD